MKVLIIDNYDSFTFNLYQYTGEVLERKYKRFDVSVRRNDEISLQEIAREKYSHIIISPGPGSPDDPAYFGICDKVLTEVGQETPVLGVCLGMQGMAHHFGGAVKRASLPMHGKTSMILHDGEGVFRGLPQGISIMRYHSLIADPASIPDCLEVTATVTNPDDDVIKTGQYETDIRDIPIEEKIFESVNSRMLRRKAVSGVGDIMGLRHKSYPVEGIQFHPESFATEAGKSILSNFLFYGRN